MARVVAALAAALVLAGCADATPTAPVQPVTSSVARTPSASASAGSVAPASPSSAVSVTAPTTASPTPTASPSLRILARRASYDCRRPTDAERSMVARVDPSAAPGPAVSLGEDWAVVAYTLAPGTDHESASALVTNGRRSRFLGSSWDGTYPDAGIVFDHGSNAQSAAMACLRHG